MSYYRTIIAIVLVVIVLSFGLTLATKWMFPVKDEVCYPYVGAITRLCYSK